MRGEQIFFLLVTFFSIAVITLLAQLNWLPNGAAKFVIIFAAGVIAIVAMRLADIPPIWFAGRSKGFFIALGLIVWGLVQRPGEARAFGLPLMTGMGTALFVVNALRLIWR